jgi:hypothetical protein
LFDSFHFLIVFNCPNRVYIKKKPVYHPPSWESWKAAASHQHEQKVAAPQQVIAENSRSPMHSNQNQNGEYQSAATSGAESASSHQSNSAH